MSSHGGMLGILLFSLYYARRHKTSWLNLGDNLVVTAPLGLFFAGLLIVLGFVLASGNLGCHANG